MNRSILLCLLALPLSLSLIGCPNNDSNNDSNNDNNEVLDDASADQKVDEAQDDATEDAPEDEAEDGGSDEPDGSADREDLIGADLTVRGTIDGSLPDGTRLVMLWSVSSGSDYIYTWGSGTTQGDTFELTLPGATAPEDILNKYDALRLGVGLIVAIKDGEALPAQNAVLEADLDGLTVGQTSNHGLIYNGFTGPLDDFDWPLSFEFGAFSCGVGEETGGTFDIFVPAPCSSIVLEATDQIDWVNWT